MNQASKSIKVLFLGQCLQYGYQGVTAAATFPQVAAAILKKHYPHFQFQFDYKFLYHPSGLKALLRHRLLLTKPDIVVISLPAMFSARSWRVNALYEIAPELVDLARSFMQQVEAKVKGEALVSAHTLLDKTFKQHPPIPLETYERLVAEAVEHARQISACRFVLMGPVFLTKTRTSSMPCTAPLSGLL